MKKLIAPLGFGIALLLLAGSAALAAPAAPSAPAAPLPAFLASTAPAPAVLFGTPLATPADICSLPRYFCQACPITVAPVRLCSERICGTVTIVNCGDCAPGCSPPPA